MFDNLWDIDHPNGLAAGTQTSDLRNDNGVVCTTVNGARLNTRNTKVGSFIGDHTTRG